LRDSRDPSDAADGACYEVRVAVTNRRALRCELMKIEGAAEAVLSCTDVDFFGAIAFCTEAHKQ
jgi:hypothetical protein